MSRSQSEHLTSRQQLFYLFGGWTLFVSSLMILAGHDAGQSLLASLMVATQFTAGFILFLVLTRWTEIGFVGAAAFGAAFGAVLAALSGIAFVSTPLSSYAWGLPVVMSLALVGKLEPIERVPTNTFLWLVAASLVGLSTEWTWLLPLALISVVVAAHQKVPRLFAALAVLVLGIVQWWLLNQRSAYWSQFRQGLTEVADYSYLESIARGTALWAHTDNILMTGTRLGYHWLSFAWAGRITESVDSTTMAFSSHIIQICFVALSISLTYTTAKKLGSGESWAIVAAFTLAMVVAVPMGLFQALTVHSPSQPFVTAMVLGGLLLSASARSIGLTRSLPVIAVFAFGVVGGKVSAVPALLVGALVFSVIQILAQRDFKASLVTAVASFLAIVGFFYFYSGVISGGETDSLRIRFFDVVYAEGPLSDPARPIWLTVLGVVAVVGGLLAVVPGMAFIDRGLRSEGSTLMWMAIFGAVASFGIGFVYVGESSGVPYFFNIGIALLIPASSLVISRLTAPAISATTCFGFLGIAIGVVLPNLMVLITGENLESSLGRSLLLLLPILFGLFIILFGGEHRRFVAALVVLGISVGSFFAWMPRYAMIQARHGAEYIAGANSISGSGSVRNAALWLRENSSESDIVATNRFCNSIEDGFPDCAAYWNVVSSITGRRMYVENLDWTARSATGVKDRALEVVRFVNDPSAERAEFLETANVSWVFVDKAVTEQENWEPWAEVVFENDEAMVLRVSFPGANQ